MKQLALSGVVLSFAATGLAFAQQAPMPAVSDHPATAATPVAAATADDALSDRDDDRAMPDSDDDDAGMTDDDVDAAMDSQDDADDDAADNDATSAPAAEQGRNRDRLHGPLGRMDTDKDGAIEKNEFGGHRAERLHGADKNGDGVLSDDEIQAMVLNQIVERRARRLKERLDVDGDGKVTLAEVDGMRNKRFAVMDRNDDGKIDARELRQVPHGFDRGDRGRGGQMGEHRPGGRGEGWMRGGPGRYAGHHGRFGGEGWRHRDDHRMRMPGDDRDPE